MTRIVLLYAPRRSIFYIIYSRNPEYALLVPPVGISESCWRENRNWTDSPPVSLRRSRYRRCGGRETTRKRPMRYSNFNGIITPATTLRTIRLGIRVIRKLMGAAKKKNQLLLDTDGNLSGEMPRNAIYCIPGGGCVLGNRPGNWYCFFRAECTDDIVKRGAKRDGDEQKLTCVVPRYRRTSRTKLAVIISPRSKKI